MNKTQHQPTGHSMQLTMRHAAGAAAIFGLILCTAVPAPAFGRSCKGVSMPDSIKLDGKKLVLNGLGLREATIFKVDVYVAGLYLEKQSSSAKKIISSDQAKKITLHFVRDVKRKSIVEAMSKGFKKAAGANYKALKPKLVLLNSWLSKMNKGQQLAFSYVPGKGLTTIVNGKKKTAIKGADFARYFVAIWLGSNPPNKGLKRGMLGGECG